MPVREWTIWPDVARAWVLVGGTEGDDADVLAKEIFNKNADWQDPYSGIVRADVVEGDYRIVVSLFAPQDRLEAIVDAIQGVAGGRSVTLLPVQKHFPAAPHTGPAYISDAEAAMEDPPAGPRDFNPWG